MNKEHNKALKSDHKIQLNAANGEDNKENKELLSAGVNINIPAKTWLYLGMATTFPAVIIIVMLILKDKLLK